VTVEVKDRPHYDEDFYAWTRDQAKHLRAQARLRQNEPLDWQELAEEVEDLGRSELHACQSLTQQIIAYLLKLQFSTAADPRAGWESEIAAFRIDLEEKLTPSIERRIARDLDRHYARALRRLKPLLVRHEPEMLDRLPASCPYTFAQILSPDDWLPETAQSEA
jgi:hypothetical protein